MNRPRHLFFDTCYYIDCFHGLVPDLKSEFLGSPTLIIGHGIVMMELYQGVRTPTEKEVIEKIEASLTLIGPSVRNYLDAGRILKEMSDRQWLRSKRLYEMQNDVLIALSAVECDACVVTRNKKDFDRIRKLCPVNVIYYG